MLYLLALHQEGIGQGAAHSVSSDCDDEEIYFVIVVEKVVGLDNCRERE